jgi:hypothetical protein
MKITKNSTIQLADGNKYWLVTAKTINNKNYCLLSTMDAPVEMKVSEIRMNGDNAEVKVYDGKDYQDILKQLIAQ